MGNKERTKPGIKWEDILPKNHRSKITVEHVSGDGYTGAYRVAAPATKEDLVRLNLACSKINDFIYDSLMGIRVKLDEGKCASLGETDRKLLKAGLLADIYLPNLCVGGRWANITSHPITVEDDYILEFPIDSATEVVRPKDIKEGTFVERGICVTCHSFIPQELFLELMKKYGVDIVVYNDIIDKV